MIKRVKSKKKLGSYTTQIKEREKKSLTKRLIPQKIHTELIPLKKSSIPLPNIDH